MACSHTAFAMQPEEKAHLIHRLNKLNEALNTPAADLAKVVQEAETIKDMAYYLELPLAARAQATIDRANRLLNPPARPAHTPAQRRLIFPAPEDM